MKTVNLTIDEELWRKTRVMAASRDISGSALMREALRQYIEGGPDTQSADEAEQRQREALVGLFEATSFELGRKPTREEIHER